MWTVTNVFYRGFGTWNDATEDGWLNAGFVIEYGVPEPSRAALAASSAPRSRSLAARVSGLRK